MRIFAGLLIVFLVTPAWTQTVPGVSGAAPTSSSANAPLLQAITVTGVQPGPGLWKVSKGDHVMWVLGILTPLPRNMQWHSAEVEQTLAQSQAVLEQPAAKLSVDVGFFGKLALLPSAYSARKNPGGASLEQILPADMYARWEVLKQQYFGNDRGVEYWRPIMVALKLYRRALDKAGLTSNNYVSSAVLKMADQHGVKRIPVEYKVVIEHPRDALNAIKQTHLHDISCFNQTLTLVQDGMGGLTERANAWSTGDIQALQGFALGDRHESCVMAVINADFAQQLGVQDLPQRMELAWLNAAQEAMAHNTQTFALLSMEDVLSPNGYLAYLKAKGYTVQAPDEQTP
ncbi:TraB/GumN family protein [Dyella sp. M7H15-1]|uniref:TraB/GumN family protein n=1 Tax=Dyella sp. M7H15-1 TaxID=2501295 RepID=UPI001004F27B|nr:TraB/GumN family protein [Dyella sp. M7H15-1]QAU24469.1 TraB/GumN family protein [Dyella sp. M7H15-1]